MILIVLILVIVIFKLWFIPVCIVLIILAARYRLFAQLLIGLFILFVMLIMYHRVVGTYGPTDKTNTAVQKIYHYYFGGDKKVEQPVQPTEDG